MTAPNPTEQVFINVIGKIVVSIFRQETPLEELLEKLEAHLAKAQRMGSLRYQAETLNAIALAHMYYDGSNKKIIIETLQQALHYAEKTDDFELLIKLLNNVSVEILHSTFDIESAERYIDQGLHLLKDSRRPLSIGIIFLWINKIRCPFWRGDFESASEILDEAWSTVERMSVSDEHRNNFVRGMHYLRQHQIRIHIVQNQYNKALAAIRINKELYETIYATDHNTPYFINQALYALICEHDLSTYEMWMDKFESDDYMLITAQYLKHLGYYPQAKQFANRALEYAKSRNATGSVNTDFAESVQHFLQELEWSVETGELA